MNTRIIAAAGLVFAVGLLASTAVARHTRVSTCSSNGGRVKGYSPTAGRSCPGGVVVSAPLFQVETLHTGTVGDFTFSTTYYYRCRESASSRDVLTPSALAAITHLRGTTWCQHKLGDPKRYLKVVKPAATVSPSGTLIGLTIDQQGLLVKVTEGSATVTAGTPARKVTVKAGTQVRVPFSGPVGSPTAVTLTPDDQVASTELRYDAVSMGGAPQIQEQLAAQGAKSALVIGDTAANVKRMRAQLAQFAQTSGFTVAQVQAKPGLVAAQLKRLGTTTIVTTGAFATTSPVWQTLRTNADLSPETNLDYVPA